MFFLHYKNHWHLFPRTPGLPVQTREEKADYISQTHSWSRAFRFSAVYVVKSESQFTGETIVIVNDMTSAGI